MFELMISHDRDKLYERTQAHLAHLGELSSFLILIALDAQRPVCVVFVRHFFNDGFEQLGEESALFRCQSHGRVLCRAFPLLLVRRKDSGAEGKDGERCCVMIV